MLYPAPNSSPTGYDMTTGESEILVRSPNKVQRVILYGTSAKLPGPDQAGPMVIQSSGYWRNRTGVKCRPLWNRKPFEPVSSIGSSGPMTRLFSCIGSICLIPKECVCIPASLAPFDVECSLWSAKSSMPGIYDGPLISKRLVVRLFWLVYDDVATSIREGDRNAQKVLESHP